VRTGSDRSVVSSVPAPVAGIPGVTGQAIGTGLTPLDVRVLPRMIPRTSTVIGQYVTEESTFLVATGGCTETVQLRAANCPPVHTKVDGGLLADRVDVILPGRIAVDTFSGNDTIAVNGMTGYRVADIDAGPGNDTIRITATSAFVVCGPGFDRVIASSGVIALNNDCEAISPG
jgi:hypothetical protein